MARLVDQSITPTGRLQRWYEHTGDYGQDQFTVVTSQPSDPAIEHARRQTVLKDEATGTDFHFTATIMATSVEDMCRLKAKLWGEKFSTVYQEVWQNQTERAREVWDLLTYGRDFRKLQASHYSTRRLPPKKAPPVLEAPPAGTLLYPREKKPDVTRHVHEP